MEDCILDGHDDTGAYRQLVFLMMEREVAGGRKGAIVLYVVIRGVGNFAGGLATTAACVRCIAGLPNRIGQNETHDPDGLQSRYLT